MLLVYCLSTAFWAWTAPLPVLSHTFTFTLPVTDLAPGSREHRPAQLSLCETALSRSMPELEVRYPRRHQLTVEKVVPGPIAARIAGPATPTMHAHGNRADDHPLLSSFVSSGVSFPPRRVHTSGPPCALWKSARRASRLTLRTRRELTDCEKRFFGRFRSHIWVRLSRFP